MATEKLVFKISAETDTAVKNVEQLEDAISQLKQELQGEDFGTAEFSRLQSELIKATKAMKNFELSVEALDAEQMASEFGSFAQGVGDITTGAFAMANAMGLAGSSAEDSLNTLVSGIAIANAFRGGIEGIISMQKLLKSSTVATSVATNGGAVAMRIFNAVVAANPIFLLITAIAAAVAAFAIFGSASDDAKDAQEALNTELENSTRAADDAVAAFDRLAARQTKDLDNSAKLLAKEREILQAKSKRTEEEEKRLRAINEQLNGIELSKFDSEINGSGAAIKDLGKVVNDNFNLIKSSIDVTDIEDGVNDINYDELLGQNSRLQTSFKQIMKAGFSPENIADQLGNLEQLRKMVGNYQATLEKKKLGMGEAEAEEFQKVIDNAGSLAGNLDKVIANADNYNAALGDKSTTKNLQDQSKTLEEIKAQEEAAKKAAEARAKAIENQKRLKEQLLKLEQEIELLGIEDEEQRAIRAIEIRLANEKKAVEGNTKEANAVRVALEKKAQLEIDAVKAEYRKKDEQAEKDKQVKEAEARALEIEKEDAQFALLQSIRNTAKEQEIADLVAEYDQKFALAQGNAELEKALEEQQQKDIAEIDKKYKEEAKAREDELLQKKLENHQKNLDTASQFAGSVNSIAQSIFEVSNNIGKKDEASKLARAKRQFNINKALAIVDAGIGTAQGIVKSIATLGPPVPPNILGILGVATAGAVGVAQIAAIASKQFNGGGSSGGGGAPSVPSVSAPTPATLNQSSLFSTGGDPTKLIGSKANQENPAFLVKAVVVESDITNTQNKVAADEKRATL